MADRKYDNSGIMFKNMNQRVGKQDADWTGTLTVNGVEYWVNQWDKSGAKGPYRTLSVKPKQHKEEAPQSSASKHNDDMDDEIPF